MRVVLAMIMALPLAGCFETGRREPVPVTATVSGPSFAPTRFDCGGEPIEPDPGKAGNKAGSAAARYEDDLKYWGRGCRNKLRSVGNELGAAGQVAK